MAPRSAQLIPAYTAEALTVVDGANLGDPIDIAEELQSDDIYHLTYESQMARLALIPRADGAFDIADGTELGAPGHALHIDCSVSFMAPDGSTLECIIAVEVDTEGLVAAVYPIPLNTLAIKTDYRVIGVTRKDARLKLAQIGCVSFTRGTRITMTSGEQRAIEDLFVGDMILTRDSGPQPIRWIGEITQKAVGAFAPVLIRAGVLNNTNDFRVSADHRLFVYQREDTLGVGRSEVMVRAQHLLNGTTITREEGGYIDYFQLLFDEHQIIYAEGIAVESLLLDENTRQVLPSDLAEKFAAALPGRDTGLRRDYELSERLAKQPDAAELLRKASTR